MHDVVATSGILATWTDARVEILRALYADGLSSSQIAGEMGGLTRNAVIGKVHRLGLRRPSHPTSGPARNYLPLDLQLTSTIAIGPTVSKQADGGIVEKIRFGVKARKALLADKDRCTTQRIASAHLRKSRAKPKRARADAAPTEFLGITFMELEGDSCRYPRGEGAAMRFCGRTSLDGKSYCAKCTRIAYQPPSSRRDNSPAPANYAGPGSTVRTAWA